MGEVGMGTKKYTDKGIGLGIIRYILHLYCFSLKYHYLKNSRDVTAAFISCVCPLILCDIVLVIIILYYDHWYELYSAVKLVIMMAITLLNVQSCTEKINYCKLRIPNDLV